MENFNWSQFTKRIQVQSDLATVYNAWTKSAELEKWFLSKATFYKEGALKVLPSANVLADSIYEWNWFAQNHFEKGLVTQANGIDFLEFTFAGNCIVQVQLTQENDLVLVELTHKDIPLDAGSKEHIRLGCAFGWTFYLINLKSVLEGGLDLRNKDTALVGVVNN
jgi:hypothetical protein